MTTSLWVRTDVLAQHPQLLTVHAPPGSVPMPHVRDGVAAAYASDPSGGFAVTGSHGPATAAMPGLAAVGFPPGFNGSVADPSQLKPASMPAQLQGVSLVRSNTGDGVASLLGMAGGAHQQPNTAAAPAQQMGGMPQRACRNQACRNRACRSRACRAGHAATGHAAAGHAAAGMPQPGYTLPGMPQYGDPNQGQHPAMQPHPTLMRRRCQRGRRHVAAAPFRQMWRRHWPRRRPDGPLSCLILPSASHLSTCKGLGEDPTGT